MKLGAFTRTIWFEETANIIKTVLIYSFYYCTSHSNDQGKTKCVMKVQSSLQDFFVTNMDFVDSFSGFSRSIVSNQMLFLIIIFFLIGILPQMQEQKCS